VVAATQQSFCPECGAPVPLRGTTVTAVCEYCGSTIVRTDVDLRLVGRVSAIVDNGSPIVLGSRGRHKAVPFEVAGRLQVQYQRGAWNEWFLNFADGSVGWLADALGQFAITVPRDVKIVAGRVPAHAHVQVGATLVIDGVQLVVVDKRAAAYRGSEGMLPFVAEPGVTFHSVDLRGPGGEFVSLDYGTRGDHSYPVPYFGGSVVLHDLGLHPLRRFQGWQPPGAPAQPRGRT
jgi:hypothetical protein